MTEAMHTMYLSDMWHRGAYYERQLPGFNLHDGPHYYGIIHTLLADVVRRSPNLKQVNWDGMDLSEEFLSALATLSYLHSITLGNCIPSEKAYNAISAGIIPGSTSVLNLTLIMHSPDELQTFDHRPLLWCVLPLFPNIRTLAVIQHMGTNPIPFPHPEDSIHYTSVQNLERILLEDLPIPDLSSFATWIEIGPAVNLTHLKVVCGLGMAQNLIQELMNALQSSPRLHTLVLEGILDASAALITQIAESCPTLRGLTLVRRHNERQVKTKLASWPDSICDYASRMSTFEHLQYFAWNAKIPGAEHSPITMLNFENDFNTHTTPDSPHIEWDLEAYEPEASVARLFAAHCKTLRMYTLIGYLGFNHVPIYVHSIERGHNNSIAVVKQHANRSNFLDWNPNQRGWPDILLADHSQNDFAAIG
ncbi:hypothetical protein HWV62_20246 [Athelia sp. TMB]|nr:hypothetical protein HWV62_20246 [Athelia sp. TMB]